MKTLDPPLVVPIDQMMRWHPLFDLNNVPDIPPALIPRPKITNEAPVSVKDFLGNCKNIITVAKYFLFFVVNLYHCYIVEKTKQLVSCNKRMERAVSQLIEGETTPVVEEKSENVSITSPAINPIPALQKALKGVPKSLLEKVRISVLNSIYRLPTSN